MSGAKLREKMGDASLADDQIRMALELRREYAQMMRTPRCIARTMSKRSNAGQVEASHVARRPRCSTHAPGPVRSADRSPLSEQAIAQLSTG